MSQHVKKSAQPERLIFLHAADLRLGASFSSLGATADGWVTRRCRQAQEEAWARIVDRAVEQRAAAVTLVGECLDRGASLTARGAWLDGLAHLVEAGIPVIVLPSPATSDLEVPEGVHRLGGDGPRSVPIEGPAGEVRALVHGWSADGHGRGPRLPSPSRAAAYRDIPQIGLGWVPRSRPEAEPPARLTERLLNQSFPLWLLGGGGGYREARDSVRDTAGDAVRGDGESSDDAGNLLVWPGSPQGLGFDEPGSHGCAEVRWEEGGWQVRRIPLSPVIWRSIEVDLTSVRDLAGARERILERLEVVHEAEVRRTPSRKAGSRRPTEAPELILAKLTLVGEHGSADGMDGADSLRPRALSELVETALGREMVVIAVEARKTMNPEVREALAVGGSLASTVLRQVELASEPATESDAEARSLRGRLLEIVREAASDRALLEEAGLLPDLDDGEPELAVERWMEQLMPLAARHVAEVLEA